MENQVREKRLLSISEAARYTGYSREMIEYWMERCGLPFEQPPTPGRKNRFRRIRREDLDNFLNNYYRSSGKEGRQVPRDEAGALTLLPKENFTSSRVKNYNSLRGSHAVSR